MTSGVVSSVWMISFRPSISIDCIRHPPGVQARIHSCRIPDPCAAGRCTVRYLPAEQGHPTRSTTALGATRTRSRVLLRKTSSSSLLKYRSVRIPGKENVACCTTVGRFIVSLPVRACGVAVRVTGWQIAALISCRSRSGASVIDVRCRNSPFHRMAWCSVSSGSGRIMIVAPWEPTPTTEKQVPLPVDLN